VRAAAALLLLLLACEKTDRPKVPPCADCLPAFRATSIDGRVLRDADVRGKPTLVMFWASWCEPCIADGPTLSAYYRTHAATGDFAMLAFSRDDVDDATLRRFRDHYQLAYPIARVADGDPAFVAFGSPVDVPTFLLYGKDGKRAARFTGALPTAILERELARLR
jgi:thiol-disulfide isomerase/thioredoxin